MRTAHLTDSMIYFNR